MKSENIARIDREIKSIENKLDELSKYIPNWIWNTILKLISLGNIDLENEQHIKAKNLMDTLKILEDDKSKYIELEKEIRELHRTFESKYINHKFSLEIKKSLEDILKKSHSYKLEMERIQFRFLSQFIVDSEEALKQRNERFIEKEKEREKDFFNSIEDNPLTSSQKKAVITNEDRNLVIAGAGSGKTSVIVAKVGYLIKKGYCNSDEILVLAFNTKAVDEIKERIQKRLNIAIDVKTFHSFGLNILNKAQYKSNTCTWSRDEKEYGNIIKSIILDKLEDKVFSKKFLNFFLEHFAPYKNEFDFKNKGEYYDYIKNNELRNYNGDLVKSYEELEISNFLTLNGIMFLYEQAYEHDTRDGIHRQYEPDFYLPDYGIYIEHFGITRDYRTAEYINNEEYVEGIKWKRQLHKENKTKLIETYSYEKKEGILKSELERKLKDFGVKFNPTTDEEAIEILNEKFKATDKFTELTKQFMNHFKNNEITFNELKDRVGILDFREKAFIDIFEIIYYEYEKKKQNCGCIDFFDMINLAIKNINKDNLHYKHILIDEFQDISSMRNKLIKSLLDNLDKSFLTVVGDDWQSIYRFAGSDVSIVKNFQEHYNKSETIFLDDTFRFDDNISEVASKFIMKNDTQISKSINTFKKAENPSIYIYGDDGDKEHTIVKIFSLLKKNTTEKKEILILGRFNHSKPKNIALLKNHYKDIFDVKYMAVHSSKGLGADYVILVDMNKGKHGFPCEIEDDPLINLIQNEEETIAFAEERRLFYVALTRAKEKLFITTNQYESSTFVNEISNDNTDKEIHNLILKKEEIRSCPDCKLGILKKWDIEGKNSFYGCSNYPLCDYTEEIKYCKKCNSIMKRDGNDFILKCVDNECGYTEPICKKCNSPMTKMNSKFGGHFWGCASYPKTGCNFTIKIKSEII